MSRSHSTGRSLRDRIARVLDVRPGERGLLITAVAFALLAVASAIVSRAVGDALFLTAYPLSSVPRFFIVSNAVFIAGSMLYSALVRVVRPVTLNVSAIGLFAVSMWVGRALVPEAGASPGLYALCVWLTVAPPLLNILCWNAIADGFDSRQARRLVPVIFAGCTVGAILAGIAMGPYIAWFGLENLLYALGVTIALCLPLPVLLARASSRSDAPGRNTFVREAESDSLWQILKEGVTTVSQSRLLRSLALIVLLAAVVTNLVDFAFKGVLQARFGRDEIGTFYGQFNAIANTGNLLLQLFVVSRVIERFGIARMFRVLPVTLLAGTLMLGLLPAFATIVGLKLVDYVLRFTFQSSANEVVIAPIPYVERNRAKIFIKGAMNPLGAVLAGALLIPLTGDAVPAGVLFVMLAVVLVVWLQVVRGVGRAHAEQLYVSLREKQQARTPVPGANELFGAGGRHRRDVASLVTSSVEWSTLSGELERHESHDESTPTRRALPDDTPRVQTPSGRWMIDDMQPSRAPGASVPPAHPDEETFPRAGLTDDAPVVRRHALERLAGAVRRGEPEDVPGALLEGLLWREIQLAYAMQCQRQSLGDVGSGPARRAASLLGERLDDTVYRIFLTMGLLGELELVRTAYLGLQADPGRTRAHALDLVEAAIEGTPFHRAVMLLLDEMSLEARLDRARRQLALRDEVFSDPVRVLMDEHDPQLNRLLTRFARRGSLRELV